MKLIVKEHINAITELDPINSYGKIPMDIGLMKGDLIVYAGEADPRRFPAGTASGKVMKTDPTAELGWVLADPDATAAILKNAAGTFVEAGRPVRLYFGTYSGTCHFVLAPVNANTPVFITGDDSMNGDEITCFAGIGTIVNVMCDTSAVARGDTIAITELGYGGPATAASKVILGIATGYKASGARGLVPVCLTGTGGVSMVTPSSEDTSIIEMWSGTSVTPVSGKVYRHSSGSIGSVEINLPASPAADFICEVDFNSSNVYTGVTVKKGTAAYEMKCYGDALNKVSKRYNLIIWWDGVYYHCVSRAV